MIQFCWETARVRISWWFLFGGVWRCRFLVVVCLGGVTFLVSRSVVSVLLCVTFLVSRGGVSGLCVWLF